MTTPDNGPPPAAGVGSSADMQADIEADREAQQLNTERIGQAFSALEEGRRDAARELMEQVLDDGRVSAGAPPTSGRSCKSSATPSVQR